MPPLVEHEDGGDDVLSSGLGGDDSIYTEPSDPVGGPTRPIVGERDDPDT